MKVCCAFHTCKHVLCLARHSGTICTLAQSDADAAAGCFEPNYVALVAAADLGQAHHTPRTQQRLCINSRASDVARAVGVDVTRHERQDTRCVTVSDSTSLSLALPHSAKSNATKTAYNAPRIPVLISWMLCPALLATRGLLSLLLQQRSLEF